VPLDGHTFLAAAADAGYNAFTGVPCSYLTPLLNAMVNTVGDASSPSSALGAYIGATSEGEAVGIAAGMWLAGRSPVILSQNSGLGNMVNPIASLLTPLRIPVLLLITWRGGPGKADEPQHQFMGSITLPLCELLGLAPELIPDSLADLTHALSRASARATNTRASSALILHAGDISPEPLLARPVRTIDTNIGIRTESGSVKRMSRTDCLRVVNDVAPADAALIASTGKCARELYSLGDSGRNLYVVGSMGCASAIGLGVALHSTRRVIVLDGDGAALMKLGNMATIGTAAAGHLVHIILNNGVHDSTGGQPTAALAGIDFAAIAIACGYRSATTVTSAGAFATALAQSVEHDGPSLIHVRIGTGSPATLARPDIAPHVVAERFREFLT
jgi:phosphonopyruvate decarboxylase